MEILKPVRWHYLLVWEEPKDWAALAAICLGAGVIPRMGVEIGDGVLAHWAVPGSAENPEDLVGVQELCRAMTPGRALRSILQAVLESLGYSKLGAGAIAAEWYPTRKGD